MAKLKNETEMQNFAQPGTVGHQGSWQPSALCVTACPSAQHWMWCANAGCAHASLVPGAFSVSHSPLAVGNAGAKSDNPPPGNDSEFANILRESSMCGSCQKAGGRIQLLVFVSC